MRMRAEVHLSRRMATPLRRNTRASRPSNSGMGMILCWLIGADCNKKSFECFLFFFIFESFFDIFVFVFRAV
jgi:hypothetical protein